MCILLLLLFHSKSYISLFWEFHIPDIQNCAHLENGHSGSLQNLGYANLSPSYQLGKKRLPWFLLKFSIKHPRQLPFSTGNQALMLSCPIQPSSPALLQGSIIQMTFGQVELQEWRILSSGVVNEPAQWEHYHKYVEPSILWLKPTQDNLQTGEQEKQGGSLDTSKCNFILTNVKNSSLDLHLQLIHQKIFLHTLWISNRLYLLNMLGHNKCQRCSEYGGDIIHMFWPGPVLFPFWQNMINYINFALETAPEFYVCNLLLGNCSKLNAALAKQRVLLMHLLIALKTLSEQFTI